MKYILCDLLLFQNTEVFNQDYMSHSLTFNPFYVNSSISYVLIRYDSIFILFSSLLHFLS